MSNELAKKEQAAIVQTVQPIDQTASIMQAIVQAASNPEVDPDKMERMMAMYERMEAKKAEAAFNHAMNACQAEMRPIAADASNPQTRSRYASYTALDKKLRPIYTKHGFSISFNTGEATEGMVDVIAYLSHEGGHTRTYHVLMPADGKGAKGGDVMTKTHATGSGMAYGMRYLFKFMFNVAVGEDDDDGNAANQPTRSITKEQHETLLAIATEVGADMPEFCKYLKVGTLENLPANKYQFAAQALNKKRAQK